MRAAALPVRRFAIHGPCEAETHYHIDPIARTPEVAPLLAGGRSVAVCAPHQSGRTTLLDAMTIHLAEKGMAVAPVTCADLATDDLAVVEAEIVRRLRAAALPAGTARPQWRSGGPWQSVAVALTDWARAIDRPLAVVVDDLDRLAPAPRGMIRSQLAASGAHAILVAGRSDPRGPGTGRLGRDARRVRLPDLDGRAIQALYAQHASAAGERFTGEALDRVERWTGGQPWLVNALARELFDGMGVRRAVQVEHVDQAAARLLAAWPTWFEQLGQGLEGASVLRAVTPLLLGTAPVGSRAASDIQAAREAGFLAPDRGQPTGALQMAAILRVLGSPIAARLGIEMVRGRRLDGSIDLPRVINAFQSIWTGKGRALAMAHRLPRLATAVVAAGLLERLVPAGSVRWQAGFGTRQLAAHVELTVGSRRRQRAVVVLKQRSDDDPHPLDRGLSDLDRDLRGQPDAEGVLILFDPRPDAPAPVARLAWVPTPSGREVMVVRG